MLHNVSSRLLLSISNIIFFCLNIQSLLNINNVRWAGRLFCNHWVFAWACAGLQMCVPEKGGSWTNILLFIFLFTIRVIHFPLINIQYHFLILTFARSCLQLTLFGLQQVRRCFQLTSVDLQRARVELQLTRVGFQRARVGFQWARVGLQWARVCLQLVRVGFQLVRVGLQLMRIGLQLVLLCFQLLL